MACSSAAGADGAGHSGRGRRRANQLADHAIALLRELEWEGPAMVEFRYDSNSGSPVLMEVNGRYWGSLPLSCQAGIDFPFYSWQLVHDQKPSPPASYKSGLRMRWLAGDIFRLSGVARQWKSGSVGLRFLFRDCGVWQGPSS